MSETTAEKIINYREVAKVYRKSHLGRVREIWGLRGLSLEVRKGEIFGLLGLNGAGKTTAMKLLTGLLFPTSGQVSLSGFDPSSAEGKRRTGFLPELPYFYSYLTPAEALAFYGRLSGMEPTIMKARIPAVLERVGLVKHAGKKAAEFSKGMLQRLGLAQAVLHNPDILVLDEPVSGLDPLAIHDMRRVISGLNRDGKTVFLSSHSISELEKICDRVAILRDGRAVRLVSQQEWHETEGGLEKIFVETVREEEGIR
ncbi:MAG: ABC transporter ATP-binding protein [bacterium]